jgi:type I restriction enzyme S subunit
MDEQEVLAKFLDARLAASDASTMRLNREISLLREYRMRLLADVATGKLDVREAAARLPDELDEIEPSDYSEVEEDLDLEVVEA